MKKYIKQIIPLVIGLLLLQSCEDGDQSIDFVFDNVTRGATLKTINLIAPTFDFNDPSVEWAVQVEFRDHEHGTSLSEVRMNVTHVGENGAGAEVLFKTVPASEFNIDGPEEFDQGILSASLTEVLAALGLQEGDYGATDQFRIRLDLALTDGRVFTSNASGNVTGGSFFSSPFAYSVQFFCFLTDASLFDGNFIVVVDTWADYAPGDIVPVIPDPDNALSFRILNTNNPFINNGATSYMLCTIDPTDGSITMEGNEAMDYGVDIFPTGSGGVGTCTGDILLNPLTFGAYGDWVFQLVKE